MIIRRRRNKNYTVIGNEPMEDTRLSADALGVLCYLRSRPDNWKVILPHLASRFKCGRDKMRRIISELIDANYISRRRIRDLETKAYVGIEYLVFDEPNDASACEPEPEKASVAPQPEKPKTAEPTLAEPKAANQADLLSNESLTNTDSHQTHLAVHTLAEARFEKFWKDHYPKRDGSNPKAPAKQVYLRLVVKHRIDPDIIDRAADAYTDELRRTKKLNTQYVAYARTWLNEQRFGDYAEQKSGGSVAHKPAVELPDDARWMAVKEKLRVSLGDDKYVSWIAPLRFLSCRDGVIQLSAPNAFMRQHIMANFESQISAAWANYADASGFVFVGVDLMCVPAKQAA